MNTPEHQPEFQHDEALAEPARHHHSDANATTLAADDVMPLESRNLGSILHRTSDAVTEMADRLNAVVLRAALLDPSRAERGSFNIEAYLARLAALIESAAEQMRLIQKLLSMIESRTLQSSHQQLSGAVERK